MLGEIIAGGVLPPMNIRTGEIFTEEQFPYGLLGVKTQYTFVNMIAGGTILYLVVAIVRIIQNPFDRGFFYLVV